MARRSKALPLTALSLTATRLESNPLMGDKFHYPSPRGIVDVNRLMKQFLKGYMSCCVILEGKKLLGNHRRAEEQV